MFKSLSISTLARLARTAVTRPAGRAARTAAPCRFSPRFEHLEDRVVLSPVTMSNQEQLLLELINRARSDPAAEVARYGIVDLNEGLPPDTISATAKQPLAPHQALINAAGAHSQDMLKYDYFSHVNLSGQTPTDRARDAGYDGSVGENIAWGGSTEPIDPNAGVYARHEQLVHSPLHRENMLLPSYREIGTGVRYGVFTDVYNYNATMVTEMFGVRGSGVFITGVAFADTVVQDQFYTIGEAVGNVTIAATRDGTVQTYTTTTGSSGGYSIPVPSGTYTVRATGDSLAGPIVVSNVVVGTTNVKVDFETSTIPVPGVTIQDDGDPGFTLAGAWTQGVAGFGRDMQYAAAGNGSAVSTWTFDVTPGQYRIWATWSPHPNRATDAPFTVTDGTNTLGTVRLNQEQTPNDLNDQGAAWEELGGTYNTASGRLVVRLANNANEYVIADAIRIQRIGDLTPEISVVVEGNQVSDQGLVEFGTTSVGEPVDRVLVVRNVGGDDLTLTPLSSTPIPPGFTLITDFDATTLAPNASTSARIRLEASGPGTFDGWLSIQNNDSDEDPFDLRLRGTVSEVQVVDRIIDDGDVGFTLSAGWVEGRNGFGRDMQYHAAGTAADIAVWTFDEVPGQYQIWATWSEHPNRATNAPFRIRDGSQVLAIVRVNQELAPDDLTYGGALWERLGGPYNISTGRLIVDLTSGANEYVIADAVRILRIGDIPPVPVPDVQIIDNGGAGFTTTNGWTHAGNQGRNDDIHYAAAGDGSRVATWTFTVTPGQYRVSATWPMHPNRATNAPYTIYDGDSALATVRVNQELAPNDLTANSSAWEDLGGPYDITGNRLVVRLSDDANEYVIADAIRIERLGD